MTRPARGRLARMRLRRPTVGDPVTATDGDTADILTYTLSGPDAASFTIDQEDDTASPDAGVTVGGQIRGRRRREAGPRDQADPYGDGHGHRPRRPERFRRRDHHGQRRERSTGDHGSAAWPYRAQHRSSYAEDRNDAVATYTAVGPDAASANWSLTGRRPETSRSAGRGADLQDLLPTTGHRRTPTPTTCTWSPSTPMTAKTTPAAM